MKKILIIGSGAGGASAANKLQGSFNVEIFEKGGKFSPLDINMKVLDRVKGAGLLFDERLINLVRSSMHVMKIKNNIVLVEGICNGGTTAFSTGTIYDTRKKLANIGIDINMEMEEALREIKTTSNHRNKWKESTGNIFKACNNLGLKTVITNKTKNYIDCNSCGECILGCKKNIKWNSEKFLKNALLKGARLHNHSEVKKIVLENGKAVGIIARKKFKDIFYPGDIIVISAGGFNTPLIISNSGMAYENRLTIDPVLCLAAEQIDAEQHREIPMPFLIEGDNYIISPYFDYLSFFFNRDWKYPSNNIISLMIKISDSDNGGFKNKGFYKKLIEDDKEKFMAAEKICYEIFRKIGIKKEEVFYGTINAGHPAGMMALSPGEFKQFHHKRLPENIYIADASIIPVSLGSPLILTVTAIANKVSCKIKEKFL